MALEKFAVEIALQVALSGVENRKSEGEEKENRGEPAGNFREHICRLRAENVFRDASAKGRAQAFASRALHQDDEHHQHGHDRENYFENADRKVHWDGQYRQAPQFVNGVLDSGSAITPLLQFRSLQRVPNLIQLFEPGVAQLPAAGAQFVFDPIEPRDKLVGRAL